MRPPLRFGIVGCGAVTLQAHLPAILTTPDTRLTGLVDKDAAWARELGGRVGCRAAGDDYRQLEGRADAAIIATPVATHADIACDLLGRGLHVLCEKPAAATSADVARMFAAARRADRRLLIGQSKRFTPTLSFLHRLVETGRLPRDGRLEASLGGRIDHWPARSDYRDRPELAGGGALMDQGVHLIDLAVWIFGEDPADVRYEATGPATGLEVDAEVRLKFPGGGSAHLAASHSRGLPGVVNYESPEGWVRTRLTGNQLEFFVEGARCCRLDGRQQPVLEQGGMLQLFSRQLRHFCAAIRQEQDPLVAETEAIRVLEILETCYRSGAHEQGERR